MWCGNRVSFIELYATRQKNKNKKLFTSQEFQWLEISSMCDVHRSDNRCKTALALENRRSFHLSIWHHIRPNYDPKCCVTFRTCNSFAVIKTNEWTETTEYRHLRCLCVFICQRYVQLVLLFCFFTFFFIFFFIKKQNKKRITHFLGLFLWVHKFPANVYRSCFRFCLSFISGRLALGPF